MAVASLVYDIGIATTADKLWAALTGDEFWRQFSGPIESDWKTGSRVCFFLPDGQLYSEGEVLDAKPPHLLSHTWPDPEGHQAPEKAQRLTWRIDDSGPTAVKLTLVHENLTENAYQGVNQSWPVILADLQRVLQAAKPLQSENDPGSDRPRSGR